MPNFKIPHNLAVWGAAFSHAVMVAGAVVLFLAGKIDTPTFAAIMAGFGGAYSGVGAVLITAKGSQAVTPSQATTTVPSTAPAPASTVAGSVKTDL